MSSKIPTSVGDWQPSTPSSKRPELLMPNAKDNPDSLTPTNKLEKFMNKGGTPSAPFGKQGNKF